MTTAAARAQSVAQALESAVRQGQARALHALTARLGSRDRAEDAWQQALAEAARAWPQAGVPASPQGWLVTVARRRGADAVRRAAAQGRRAAALAPGADAAVPESPTIPDVRLRLILACCHPALDLKTRVALTLRVVCGLDMRQVARLFLDSEAAMARRLGRARAFIARAGLRYAQPGPDDWPARRDSVLAAIRLVYTTAYAAGPCAGADLAAEALFLARLCARLFPAEPEVLGCLALIALSQARAPARVRHEATAPPAAQDRSAWDRRLIIEGHGALAQARALGQPGRYQLMAAVSACHLVPGGPDWPRIAALTERLLEFEDTPVIRLNLAVALAETGQPARGLALLETLAGDLGDYQPWHAAQAHLLALSGQTAAARAAYEQAIARAPSAADAAFLRARAAAL